MPPTLKFPSEIIAEILLPMIRRELAKHLVQSGITQIQTSKLLGVSESAVSLYLKNKRGVTLEGLGIELDSEVKEKIKEASDQIIEGMPVICVVHDLINAFQEKKILCEIHKRQGISIGMYCRGTCIEKCCLD